MIFTAMFVCAAIAVSDGDTFRCQLDGGEIIRVRVRALHAPELRDPGGNEAKAALRSVLLTGRTMCIAIEVDRYGRIVGDCFVGQDLTTMMINTGTTRHCPAYGREELSSLPDNGINLPPYCEKP